MDRNEEQTSHYVKLVQLPSGKTIEVVHFGDPAGGGDLHRCLGCRSELVYPIEWTEAEEDTWQLTLRCPECETIRDGVFARPALDAFDDRLEDGTEALVVDLRRLTHRNMCDEGESFFAALAVGAILPEDF